MSSRRVVLDARCGSPGRDGPPNTEPGRLAAFRYGRWVAAIGGVGVIWASFVGRAEAQSSSAASISPREVVQTAMSHNPELRSAVLEWQQANLSVVSQDYEFVPNAFAEARYSGGRRPAQGVRGVSILTNDSIRFSTGLSHQFRFGTQISGEIYAESTRQDSVVLGELGQVYGLGASFDLTQPWLRGFGRSRVLADLHIARLQQDAALAAREQTAARVARQVLVGYWSLWLAQQRLAINQSAMDVAHRELSRARERLAAGVYSDADLIALKTELARLREQVITSQSNLDDQAIDLARLMGQSGHSNPSADWTAAVEPPESVPVPELDQTVAVAEKRSYQLHQLSKNVDIARVRAGVADDLALPKLDTTASLGVSGLGADAGGAYEQIRDLDGVNGFISVRLELPVVDRGLDANARRAQIAVKTARYDYQSARDQLRADLATLVNEMDATAEQLELTRKTARLAARQTDVQTTLLDNGRATMFDVVDAIQQQSEAKLRIAQNRVQLVQLQIRLQSLAGTLVERLGAEVDAGDRRGR